MVARRAMGAIVLGAGAAAAVLLPLAGVPLARQIGSSTSTRSWSSGNVHVMDHAVFVAYAPNWIVCVPLAVLMLVGTGLLVFPCRRKTGT